MMTVLAQDLKKGMRITWTGSFAQYDVLSDPTPDETMPDRVVFDVRRFKADLVTPFVDMRTRLPANMPCCAWRG